MSTNERHGAAAAGVGGRAAPPGELAMTWLIARRAALEALNDRMTLLMAFCVAVLLPLLMLLVSVRPLLANPDTGGDLAGTLAFDLLLVGLVPTASAVGVAAGQFAGEKERGVLTPLLASPASNFAIFAGKVLGSIVPALMYAAVADVVFLIGLVVLLGPDGLRQMPVAISAAMLLLVPEVTCFAASVASLISSRVRTFNSAQQVAGLVLMPLWAVVFGLAFKLEDWGVLAMIGALVGVLVLDVVVAAMAAQTWRREEVLSQR